MPCGIELRSLEQSRLNAGFLQLRKKITVMDDRRNEQG